ncbi:MAG TPA: hypothetical protein VLF41_03050 [Candidatus Nanoarchaeia archaeon]|nr:hypothetical protein [Candidatus Nanoarchaeia archaeon]
MQPLLHPKVTEQLETVLANPSSAYIFYGSSHIGKSATTGWLAQRFNCKGDETGKCANCRAIASGNYPDFVRVTPDGQSIGISQIHELQETMSLMRYYQAGRRVVVIEQADKLTIEAQNSLLKLLEEPPEKTTLILVTDQLMALLPTIRSRCQAVHFANPDLRSTQDFLSKHLGLPGNQVEELIQLSEGKLGLAISLSQDADALELRRRTAADCKASLDAKPFQRLLTAAKLSESPEQAVIFIESLTDELRHRLRQSDGHENRWSQALEAVERFERWRAANVGLKPALEGLLLEL